MIEIRKSISSYYINDFYMRGTCGDYSCRKFFINLNFTKMNPRGYFKLSPGEHEIEVIIEDVVGNKTSSTFRWQVI